MNRECAEAGRNIAPELRSKADDEIRSSRSVRGSRRAEIVEANSLHLFASRMSNSRCVGGRSKKVRIWTLTATIRQERQTPEIRFSLLPVFHL